MGRYTAITPQCGRTRQTIQGATVWPHELGKLIFADAKPNIKPTWLINSLLLAETHAVNATATASTSLIGRGLSANSAQGNGLARPELDTRYPSGAGYLYPNYRLRVSA